MAGPDILYAHASKVLRNQSARFLEAAEAGAKSMYQSDDQSGEQSSASQRKERASQRIRQKGCDRVTPNERRDHWPQLREEISEADEEFPAQKG